MRKLGLLCLVFVIALGSLGVGYAMWSNTLSLEGQMTTGEVNVIFDSQFDNDNGNQLDPSNAGSWTNLGDEAIGDPVWVGTRYLKHVGSTTSSYGDDWAKIVITTGYPSYWGSVIWDLVNKGDIPAKLWSVTLTEISMGNTQIAKNMTLVIGTTYYVNADNGNVDTTLDAGDDFSFILSSHGTDQIDPQTWNPKDWNTKGYLDVTVHIEQDATEKTSYDFSINYLFCNWNEVAS